MIVVVVAGTGTEVGKTWVSAAVATELRSRNETVVARKPVQSFAPDAGGRTPSEPTDADLLAAATGEQPTDVCPEHRWLPIPMAPPMAATALGRRAFTIRDLVTETTAAIPTDGIVLLESAGGVRSPLADDGDTVALAGALQPALVVLVTDAGLGTINLVRLCADALAAHNVVVYMNRFDPRDELHVRNRDWLVTRESLDVVTDIEALAAFLQTVRASC
jgi:dethiobiotin synthetase